MDTQNGPPSLGSIQFLTGSLAGSTFQITKATITLGREPGSDIVISDPSVSRHHAQITWSNGVWMINKLAQQNTVTVNQREVQQSPINNRDTIGLGGTTFLFQTHGSVSNPAYAPPLTAQQAFPGASAAKPQAQATYTNPSARPQIVPPPPPVYS
ncbi:MAG: FHA domain-containing protein, partial [Ktedonobacteraceae bacterium]